MVAYEVMQMDKAFPGFTKVDHCDDQEDVEYFVFRVGKKRIIQHPFYD